MHLSANGPLFHQTTIRGNLPFLRGRLPSQVGSGKKAYIRHQQYNRNFRYIKTVLGEFSENSVSEKLKKPIKPHVIIDRRRVLEWILSNESWGAGAMDA
jgi:hypothetical protein